VEWCSTSSLWPRWMSAALASAAQLPEGKSQGGFIPRSRPVSPASEIKQAGHAGQSDEGHSLKQLVSANSSAASGSADGSTSAGSTEGSLEDTINSTASKEYSFGHSHNAALAAASGALTQAMKSSSAEHAKDVQPSTPSAAPSAARPEEHQGGGSPASSTFPASSSSSPSPRSPGKRREKLPSDEDDEDSGNEFTFGTSAPIQLPDFSQMPKPTSHHEGSLRQAGSPGDDRRELALLSTVSEVPEVKPPPPASPPPASVRAPPPPVGSHPHPYVSPRHSSAWQAEQMQAQQMQAQQMQAQQMQAQMYASNPAAMALYDPSQAAAHAAAYDQLALAQAPSGHQDMTCHEAGYYDPESGQQEHGHACEVDDAYGPYFDGKQAEEEDLPSPPLAIKLAFMLEAFCAEAGNCKREQVKRWMAGIFMLLILIGAFTLVAVLLKD